MRAGFHLLLVAALAVAVSLFFAGASPARASSGTDCVQDPDTGQCYTGCYTTADCGTGSGETWESWDGAGAYAGDSYDAAGGRCKTRHADAKRDNLTGIRVFTYYQQVKWCWRNGLVTYFHRDRWTGGTNLGWSFDGHVGTNCGYEDCHGRVGHSIEEVWTQGHYHVGFTVMGVGYIVNKYPAVDIWVGGNGTSGASWGGA